jgi:ribosomal-protein-alanine N-acetyltransferase
MIRIRAVEVADAAALASAYRANRRFLAPWEPIRDDAFYTPGGQRSRIATGRSDAASYGCVILDDDGSIVGTIALSGIVRGPAQSANLGYWVGESSTGRGLATLAVRLILDVAFGELDLHRVQAGTLRHNVGSQKVLERNGFERIGVARSYLLIAGEWQDHVLFQRVTDR